MCIELGLEHESRLGMVLKLCRDVATELPDDFNFNPRVSRPRGEPGGNQQSNDPDPHSFVGPVEAVIRAFNATVAVVEFGYFDLDYRSEFTVINQTSFAVDYPGATRIHFFGGKPPHRGVHLRDAVESLSESYLGYTIVRHTSPPSVGRSMISPSRTITPILRDATTLQNHIRTAVDEYVDLFGVQLKATGVPFMEQDGRLLRCAHVTAWMAHYSAVLRGLVARRPSAEFNSADVPQSYGRSYPSDGLSLMSQSMILSRLDLPPEVLAGDDLLRSIRPSWHHREELTRALASGPSSDRIILVENLTSTICRYLNSGMPVILNRNDENHSVLVCGYLRIDDLEPDAQPTRSLGESDVVALIVQDDQAGPYRVVLVSDVIRSAEIATQDNFEVDLSIVVPLPRGLWLSGMAAEVAGGSVFAQTIQNRAAALSRRGRHGMSLREKRAAATVLERMSKAISSGDKHGKYTLRSYALSSSDFKYDFCRRFGDNRASRVVGTTRMSRYVWVVELLDRELRARGEPSVLGTVVFDGTAVSEDGVARTPDPLLIQVPGQIAAVFEAEWSDGKDKDPWMPTTAMPYHSGRWNHKYSSFMQPHSVAARHKGATVQ